MKIAVCSDVHLEFGPLNLKNPGDVDVLILSGDILVENDLDEWNEQQVETGFARNKSNMFHRFFQDCASQFPHVIYVAGNHEHYHGDFRYTLSSLKHKFKYLTNVHVLDKEILKIDDITFVGGTLWTNMNNEDPMTMYHIKSMMNDFNCVKNSNREVSYKTFEVTEDGRQIPSFKTRVATFSPEDAVEENKKCFDYIKHIVSENDKVVVVGHHTPSRQSMHPRYSDDEYMNGGYHNDYVEYILDHPQIKLWTHGHTHERYDYMIGSTRVVCNPRGYLGYESISDTFKLKVVEVC